MPLSEEEIHNRFGFHKATIEGPEATLPRHAVIREVFLEMAEWLDEKLPDGREKDLALTALEEASMWAHKGTAKQAPLSPS